MNFHLVDLLEPSQICFERAGRHELGHQDDALLRPKTIKSVCFNSIQEIGFIVKTSQLTYNVKHDS